MRRSLLFIVLFGFVFLNLTFAVESEVRAEDDKNSLRMILPKHIYTVPGIESNVYFDNTVLVINPANYVFDVHCSVGHTQNERWTITAKDKQVGEYSFKLNILNQKNEIVATQESKLHVISNEAGAGKKISLLMIGDSLTHASAYPKHIVQLSKKTKGFEIKLIGSHNPSKEKGLLHEGYGGWTAVRFVTHFTENARTGHYHHRGSPFLYRKNKDGKPKLDFARYCKELNGSQAPDFVTIFLGPNDVYRCTDTNIEKVTDTMIEHLDILVKMINDYSATTKIGLMLPVPASASQDAFGTGSGRRQTRWQYKRNQHRLIERMLAHYHSSKVVSVIPTHLNIDTVHNYPSSEVTWNSRVQLKTIRQNNAVHPDVNGYHQIGDSVFSWLKSELQEPKK